jgi:hypothetical protein
MISRRDRKVALALWQEVKRAMDDTAKAYLTAAPDAVEKAESAIRKLRDLERQDQPGSDGR